MSGPVQLTIAASGVPAPYPGPGVDPDGSSEPVEAAFGAGAGGSSPTDLDRPVSEPPIRITFGPGPAPGTPTSSTPTPGGAAGTSSRPDAGGSGTDNGEAGSSGSPTGGPSTSRPTQHRWRTGRSPHPAGGPSSGSSTAAAITSTSRPGRIINLLRRGRVTASGSPTRRIAVAKPAHAPRPGRPASGESLFGWVGAPGGALNGLLRSGCARASRLTPEDWRVIGILAVALIVALGGQVDLGVPAVPLAAPAQTSSTTTSARVLELAGSQVGTTEARDGSTPYHRTYGIAADQPWCAVFVWDMFREAGASDLIGPKTAYTPTLAGWFRQRGQWSGTPTVGALVFYDWPGDGRDRIQHVGIVESVGPNTIQTIEANTSSGVAGSQDNGGGVWRRTRPRNGSIVGFGLPAYSVNPQSVNPQQP